jgi:glycosyltransferase involved in cell wall biosynthesis
VRIAAISNLPPPYGGAEVFGKILLSSLAQKGEKITVITQKMYAIQPSIGLDVINYPYLHEKQQDLIDNGVKIFPLFTTSALKDFSRKRKVTLDSELVENLEKIFREEKPELIHSHFTTKTILEASRISREMKIPLVVTMHGMTNLVPIEESTAMGGLSTDQIVSILSSCAQVVVVDQTALDFCHSRGLKNSCKITSGVDRKFFSLGNHKDRSGILYIGKHNMLKGLKETIKAFLKTADKFKEHLFLVGRGIDMNGFNKTGFFLDPEEQDSFENLFKEKRIHFLGELDPVDLRDKYRSSKLLVLPSLSEGFPLSILEALSCGTPVVASDVGSISEVIQNGRNGYLIPKADPEELAKAMVKLVNGRNSNIEYVCRESTVEYEITKIAQSYISLFQRIINEN